MGVNVRLRVRVKCNYINRGVHKVRVRVRGFELTLSRHRAEILMAGVYRYFCISSPYTNIYLLRCSFGVFPLASTCYTFSNALHQQSYNFHGDQQSIKCGVEPKSLYLASVVFHHVYSCNYFYI